jgi:hypothetical protein
MDYLTNTVLREHAVISAAALIKARYNTVSREYRDDNNRFGIKIDSPFGELRFVEMTPDSVMMFGDKLWEPVEISSAAELVEVLNELDAMYGDLAMLRRDNPDLYS